MERDKRWEDVWAEVIPPGDERGWGPKDCYVFLVEIRYRGQLIQSKILVHEDDFFMIEPGWVYKHTLNEMIYNLDKKIEEWGEIVDD